MNYRAYRRCEHSWYFVSGHDSLYLAKLDLLEHHSDAALCVRNIRGELVWKQSACEPNKKEEHILKTNQCERIPFPVEEVRVSEDNIEEVAAWCNGSIEFDEARGEDFIQVEVTRPSHEGQTRAYVGDHVLKSGTVGVKQPGFKVYLHDSFVRCFRRVHPTITKVASERRAINAERKQQSTALRDQAIKMNQEGYTNVLIARELGIAESSVRSLLQGPDQTMRHDADLS